MVRVQLPHRHRLIFQLDYGNGGGHCHNGIEVSLGHPELQVAESVCLPGANKSVVRGHWKLQHVSPAADLAMFLALGQLGAHAGWGEKAANTRACGSNPFGQSSLRYQLGLDFAIVVHSHEGRYPRGMSRCGEGADHLAHLARFNQGSHVDPTVYPAVSVGDTSQLLRALPVQGRDQVLRRADPAKSREHDGGRVGNIGHGQIKAAENFV